MRTVWEGYEYYMGWAVSSERRMHIKIEVKIKKDFVGSNFIRNFASSFQPKPRRGESGGRPSPPMIPDSEGSHDRTYKKRRVTAFICGLFESRKFGLDTAIMQCFRPMVWHTILFVC